MNLNDFKKDLQKLLNEYSIENGSNTPDFILTEYICNCIQNFNVMCNSREMWYDRYDTSKYYPNILDPNYEKQLQEQQPNIFFVDTINGDDNNNGLNETSPLKSVKKVIDIVTKKNE